MDKKLFDELPKESQWIVIKEYLHTFQTAVESRMAVLPIMAGLGATLLVVATFNQELIPLDNLVRVVVTLLLVCIPASLYFYNYDLKSSATRNQKTLEELKVKVEIDRNFLGKISRFAPDVFIYLFALLVLLLISKIWHITLFN